MHNATWGKHRHFYDCIFMIFTLQLENYNCKTHSLARSNILLHLIQIWSGIRITKQITTQLSSMFLIICRQYPFQPQCWNDLLLFSIDCILHRSLSKFLDGYPWSNLSFFLSKQLTTKKGFLLYLTFISICFENWFLNKGLEKHLLLHI